MTPRPVLRVGLDKAGLRPGQAAGSASRLAQLLDIDAKDFLKQVRATGPKAFVQGIVYRKQEAPAGLLDSLSAIPGARAISDKLPLAPTKDFAAAILGTVGPATAELVKEGKGRIKAGDDVGLSGLQKRYDEQLSGTRGATVAAVNDEGERRTLFTAEPTAGSSLHTTLDVDAQAAAEQALSDVGPASALVAIRPSTGDLVAVASGSGSNGLQHGHLRPLRAGVDVQGGQRAGPAAVRRHAADPGPLPADDGGGRQDVQELLRLPVLGLRRDQLRGRPGQLLQHRLHLPARQARPPVTVRGGGRPRVRGRPRHRVPDLLRRGRQARQRDPGGGQHDRPGCGARLADGDGHRGRVGGEGLRGAATPAPGPRDAAAGTSEAADRDRGPAAAHADARRRGAGQRRGAGGRARPDR